MKGKSQAFEKASGLEENSAPSKAKHEIKFSNEEQKMIISEEKIDRPNYSYFANSFWEITNQEEDCF